MHAWLGAPVPSAVRALKRLATATAMAEALPWYVPGAARDCVQRGACAMNTVFVIAATVVLPLLLLLLLLWRPRWRCNGVVRFCTDSVYVPLPSPAAGAGAGDGETESDACNGRAEKESSAAAAATAVHVLPPIHDDDDDGDDGAGGGAGVCARGDMACVAAATGAPIGRVPRMGAQEVRVRVEAARAAQPAWSRTSFAERRRVMREMRHYVLRHQRDIIAASVLDTGKTAVDAVLGEILTTLEKLRWVASTRRGGGGERALAPEYRSVGPMTLHKRARVEFVPLGVIGAIAPWNYPFHNMYNPLIAALFAGNAIVLKCSEYSSWSSVYFARIARAVLVACGHPAELVQLVTGDGEAGAALVADDGVDKVFFTGSTHVGRAVARAAADSLKPVVLELGGKDAMVVCDDADFEQVCHIALRGVFQNAGQNCVGVERIYVQRALYERFVARMVRDVQRMRLGDDLGAMTMGAAAVRHVRDLVEDATRRGGRVRNQRPARSGSDGDDRDGCEFADAGAGGGYYLSPYILTDVPHDARIFHEEVFGPVMLIAPFDTDTQALTLVNDSAFGLGSSVFTLDRARGERLARGIRAGMTNINDFGVNYLCQSLPFGGTKCSGSDRFAGVEGLRGCCLMKSVTVDQFTCVRTRIPLPLRYPMCVRAAALPFAEALVRLIYDDAGGVAGRARALLDMVRAIRRSGRQQA